ncbi:MAG: YhcH/YjgK/YiaL family protein [Bacilli bacterium]
MIIDKIENLGRYIPPSLYSKIRKGLTEINKDTPNGLYPVDENVFIKVMDYDLMSREECKIEAHNEYVDVQSVLIGEEGVGIFDRETLSEIVPYSAEKDVVFFSKTGSQRKHEITVHENEFVLLFPNEAHSPKQLMSNNIKHVKKFVIKIKVSLISKRG